MSNTRIEPPILSGWLEDKAARFSNDIGFRDNPKITLCWASVFRRDDNNTRADLQDPELLLRVGDKYYPLKHLLNGPPLVASQFIVYRYLGVID